MSSPVVLHGRLHTRLPMGFPKQGYWSGLPFPSPPFLLKFIYLAALGLSRGMRESSLQCMDSPVVGPNCSAVCEILVSLKVVQSCPTLCNPTDYTVHGILQARILVWVVFPSSRGSSQPRDRTQVSRTAGGFFTS